MPSQQRSIPVVSNAISGRLLEPKSSASYMECKSASRTATRSRNFARPAGVSCSQVVVWLVSCSVIRPAGLTLFQAQAIGSPVGWPPHNHSGDAASLRLFTLPWQAAKKENRPHPPRPFYSCLLSHGLLPMRGMGPTPTCEAYSWQFQMVRAVLTSTRLATSLATRGVTTCGWTVDDLHQGLSPTSGRAMC